MIGNAGELLPLRTELKISDYFRIGHDTLGAYYKQPAFTENESLKAV